MNYILLFTGIGLSIYDGILELTGKTTISRWYQKLFPRWADWVFFVCGISGLIVLSAYIDPRILIVWAGFWGHITIANKERYGE